MIKKLFTAFFIIMCFGLVMNAITILTGNSTPTVTNNETQQHAQQPPAQQPPAENTSPPVIPPDVKAKSAEFVNLKIGETIQTEYFDVTVNNVAACESLVINQFSELKKEPDARYILMNITIKNNSDESRFSSNGNLLIYYDNRFINFDKTEFIIGDDWGLGDQLNPMLSKTGKLAFKIPKEIHGDLYYVPARSKLKLYVGWI